MTKKILTMTALLACVVTLTACTNAEVEKVSNDPAETTPLSYSSSDVETSERVVLLDTIYKGVYLERGDVDEFLGNMQGTTYGKYFARAWNEGPCYHSDLLDADIYIGTSIDRYASQPIKFDGKAGKVYDFTDRSNWFDETARSEEKVVDTEFGSFVLYY